MAWRGFPLVGSAWVMGLNRVVFRFFGLRLTGWVGDFLGLLVGLAFLNLDIVASRPFGLARWVRGPRLGYEAFGWLAWACERLTF